MYVRPFCNVFATSYKCIFFAVKKKGNWIKIWHYESEWNYIILGLQFCHLRCGHSGYLLSIKSSACHQLQQCLAHGGGHLGNEWIGSCFTNSWYNWQHLFKGCILQGVLGRRRVDLPRTGCFLTLWGLSVFWAQPVCWHVDPSGLFSGHRV